MGLKLLAICLMIFSLASFAAAEVKSNKLAHEKNLYIYGDLDSTVATILVKEFEAGHKGIKVDFITMRSSDVFSRYMNDVAANRVSADILWNSDVTLQAALLKDGYALTHSPPADPHLLAGSDTSGAVFTVAVEPVVMVYNKNLLSEKELPLSRETLGKAFEGARWKGKAGAVDPEKSSAAFLLLTQDLAYGRDFWGFVRKSGGGGLKVYPDYQALLSSVENGEIFFAYNIPLSEAMKACGKGKNAVWYYMKDYNFAVPASVLMTKGATNSTNARLWIEFVRTEKAQKIISSGLNRYSVRKDLTVAGMSSEAGALPEGGRLRIIAAGSEITRFMPDGVRRGFILKWKQLLKLVK